MKAFMFVTVMLMTLSLSNAPLCSAQSKQAVQFATISSREVLQKCDKGAQIIKDLNAKFAERKHLLAAQELEVQRIQKEAATPGAKPAKQQELKLKQEKFQQDFQRLNQDVNSAEMESFKPIIEKIRQVLQDYSKEKGIVAIQERAQLVFSDPSLDITEEIIKRTNQK